MNKPAPTRTAFVTGGAGFVGGGLCEALAAEGWEVRALVRATSRTARLDAAGCQLVHGSLEPASMPVITEAVSGADVVFHLAGVTKAIRPGAFRDVNGRGASLVARAARRANFRGRFILMSSLAAAGPAPKGRLRTEADPPAPVSLYGRSKLVGERAAMRRAHGFLLTILRPGAIYGPHEHEMYEVIRTIARSGLALSTGPDINLQLTHVDDVVGAALTAANTDTPLEGAYFINDQEVWRYSQVMDCIGRALKRRVRQVRLPLAAGWTVAAALDLAGRIAGRPLSPFGMDKMREVAAGSWTADCTRFMSATGWRARRSLPEGMRETIDWYRAEGWL